MVSGNLMDRTSQPAKRRIHFMRNFLNLDVSHLWACLRHRSNLPASNQTSIFFKRDFIHSWNLFYCVHQWYSPSTFSCLSLGLQQFPLSLQRTYSARLCSPLVLHRAFLRKGTEYWNKQGIFLNLLFSLKNNPKYYMMEIRELPCFLRQKYVTV